MIPQQHGEGYWQETAILEAARKEALHRLSPEGLPCTGAIPYAALSC